MTAKLTGKKLKLFPPYSSTQHISTAPCPKPVVRDCAMDFRIMRSCTNKNKSTTLSLHII